jgi:hypothetical protein
MRQFWKFCGRCTQEYLELGGHHEADRGKNSEINNMIRTIINKKTQAKYPTSTTL